VKVGLSYQQEG